jgi:glycerophosphoryl diester phosphodiesterase
MKTQPKTIKVIAHRGDSLVFPENTLAAFVSALEKGADAIELDIHMSSDGVLFVHHDSYLGSPDDGEGELFKKDSGYIRSLRIKDQHTIPTLKEVFELIGWQMEYELEIKNPSETALTKVLALAYEAQLLDKIEFTSPQPYVLTKLRELAPECRTGMFVNIYPEWMGMDLGSMLTVENAVAGKITVIHCPLNIIDPSLVQLAHSRGLLVHAADCSTKEDILKAMKLGVDQFSTNDLSAALVLRSSLKA